MSFSIWFIFPWIFILVNFNIPIIRINRRRSKKYTNKFPNMRLIFSMDDSLLENFSWSARVRYSLISITNIKNVVSRYCLSAGLNNTERHFTAIIMTNTGNYARFNDVHPRGCFFHDGLLNVEFALYTLRV